MGLIRLSPRLAGLYSAVAKVSGSAVFVPKGPGPSPRTGDATDHELANR
jgi:hypothetical protein